MDVTSCCLGLWSAKAAAGRTRRQRAIEVTRGTTRRLRTGTVSPFLKLDPLQGLNEYTYATLIRHSEFETGKRYFVLSGGCHAE